MSTSSTPPQERDAQLLSVGRQCSAPSCLLVDFLPFKCQHCSHSYCGDHFLPNAHKCDKYDESKHNRIAPACPLCNTPVAIPPGQDPNLRMEQHIDTECSVMTGKSRTRSTPVCARAKCGKVLFAPITCAQCKQQFCPQHRFPGDHTCSNAATAKSISKSQPFANLSSQTSAAGAAAAAAVKRVMAPAVDLTISGQRSILSQTQPKGIPPPVGKSSSSSSSSRSNPFSQADRPISPSRTYTPSSNVTLSNTTTLTTTTNDPPTRCAPTLTSNNLFDPYSFIPPPVFATA